MVVYKRLLSVIPNSTSNLFNYSAVSRLFRQPCATINMRIIEKKLGLPPKPKRPVGPFIKYTCSEKHKVMKDHPNWSPPEVMRKLSQMWKSIDSAEKEVSRQQYLLELREYTQQMMQYDMSLTKDHKLAIETEKCRMADHAEKLKRKARIRELGRPKKPPTSFLLYMMDQTETQNKDTKHSEWITSMVKKWTAAEPEIKMKYLEKNKKLYEEYRKAIVDWEEKMIKLGYIDVIRKHVLKDLKGEKKSL